jgi:hypothetical protein
MLIRKMKIFPSTITGKEPRIIFLAGAGVTSNVSKSILNFAPYKP